MSNSLDAIFSLIPALLVFVINKDLRHHVWVFSYGGTSFVACFNFRESNFNTAISGKEGSI